MSNTHLSNRLEIRSTDRTFHDQLILDEEKRIAELQDKLSNGIQLNPNSYYLILNGNAQVTFLSNNNISTIPSAYNDQLKSYQDVWVYDDMVQIAMDPDATLITIKATKQRPLYDNLGLTYPANLSIKCLNAQNNIIELNANAGSVLIVHGNNFLYTTNTSPANTEPRSIKKKNKFKISEDSVVKIDATTLVHAILIEEIN